MFLKSLRNKPRRADKAILVFDCLIQLLELGEEGRIAAIAALENGIRLCYRFTEEHELAYEYYRRCLNSELTDTAAVSELLSDALKRLQIKEEQWKNPHRDERF